MTVTYHCPECDSKEVTTLEGSSFFINTGKFFCHSVKCHDSDSPSFCHDCKWEGVMGDLVQREIVKPSKSKEQKIAALRAKIKRLEEEE